MHALDPLVAEPRGQRRRLLMPECCESRARMRGVQLAENVTWRLTVSDEKKSHVLQPRLLAVPACRLAALRRQAWSRGCGALELGQPLNRDALSFLISALLPRNEHSEQRSEQRPSRCECEHGLECFPGGDLDSLRLDKA